MASEREDVEITRFEMLHNEFESIKEGLYVLQETIDEQEKHIADLKRGRSEKGATAVKLADYEDDVPAQEKGENGVRKETDDKAEAVKQGFQGLVKEYVESSTLHGLHFLVESSIWGRILWFLALTAAAIALSMQFSVLIRSYLTFDVLTVVDVEEGNMRFPAITICNNRRFLASQVASLPLFSNLSLAMNGSSDTTILTEVLSKLYDELTPQDLNHLGANVSDTIVVQTLPENGTAQIEKLPYHGSCYSIKPPKGTKDMTIAFDLHINDSIDVSTEWHAGVTVYMKDNPVKYPTYEPVLINRITKGVYAASKITQDVIERLNGSYGQCQDNEITFFNETGIGYEQQACFYNCEFQSIISKCKCFHRKTEYFPFWLQHTLKNPITSTLPLCNLTTDSKCMADALKGKLKCDCKPNCNAIHFQYETQLWKAFDNGCQAPPIAWFCELISKLTATNITKDWLEKNVVVFHIRLTKKSYTTYTQKPAYPLLRFLADNGGTMGFYLGASMLTYFELVQFSVSTILHLYNWLKHMRRS